MAYEKQTWSCGEIVTPAKLNHMEQGIEDANDIAQQLGGRFVKYSAQAVLTQNQVTEVALTEALVQTIFGTTDTSKIHILATDMYRVVGAPEQGHTIKAWCNSYFNNTSAGVTYVIPQVELFDIHEYPWVEQRLGRVFLNNINQQDATETVTWRLFAFVED